VWPKIRVLKSKHTSVEQCTYKSQFAKAKQLVMRFFAQRVCSYYWNLRKKTGYCY